MKKARLLTILAIVMAVAMIFSACGGEVVNTVNYYAGDNYNPVTGDMEYNENLFYRNDIKVRGADPFLFDNTSRDGYYYCYVTQSDLSCYRTKDLSTWENYGDALGLFDPDDPQLYKDMRDAVTKDIWAPEVAYDAEADKADYGLGEGKGVYYIFFSATPEISRYVNDRSSRGYGGSSVYVPYLGVSNYAGGPYKLVDFTDAASCGGEENVHDIDKGAYPQFYSKFCFLNMDDLRNAFCALDDEILADTRFTDTIDSGHSGYARCIDMHPFVDEDGQKYWYGVMRLQTWDLIFGMRMENWAKPDYSTLSIIVDSGYYTVADKRAQNINPVESNTKTNEGPQMIYHYNSKGEKLYYLTYSINGYTNSAYCLCTAVMKDQGNGPLGDMTNATTARNSFRKLREEENGVWLSSDSGGNEKVSGPGHHTMLHTEDGKLYCVYHRHDVYANGGGARNPAIDECHWITIENDPLNNGEDLDTLYINGPTWALVPRLQVVGSSEGPFGLIKAEYTDISLGARLTASGKLAEDSSAEYLNDDLLSIYKNVSWQFIDDYIRETEITGETSFNFEFDGTKEVVAVMVYNSKLEDRIFKEIKSVELVADINGKDTVITISNLKFDLGQFARVDEEGFVEYVQPGSVVFAEFNALKVKSVKFTIDVPEGQETVGISEIRILGK